MSLTEYATPAEQQIASKLVHDILAAGYCITVNDGEEDTVVRSKDRREILGALATTDHDWLKIMTPATGLHLGRVMLVWGNGTDLISDSAHPASSDGHELEALLKGAVALADEIAAEAA